MFYLTTSLLSIIVLSLAAVAYGQHNGYNQNCSNIDDCSHSFACLNGACRCPAGYQYDRRSSKCRPFSEMTCWSDADCQDADANRECAYGKLKCDCNYQYYPNSTDNICYRVKSHDEACQTDRHCDGSLICKIDRTESWGRCRCWIGYLWQHNFDSCTDFEHGACSRDIDCQDWDPLRRCVKIGGATRCHCPFGFWPDSTGYCSDGSNATTLMPTIETDSTNTTERPGFNEACNWYSDCQSNLSCIYGRCGCDYGYQWSHWQQQCVWIINNSTESPATTPGPTYNSSCYWSWDCPSTMWCNNYRCQCRSGYEWSHWLQRCVWTDNNSTTIEPNTTEPSTNLTCRWNRDCPSNMICSYGRCRCDYGYEWSDWQQRCVWIYYNSTTTTVRPTNDTECYSDYECQYRDPNLICSNYSRCVCRYGYQMDYNGKCRQNQLMTWCWSNRDCPIVGSVCNQNKYRNRCTCRQTHVWSAGLGRCRQRYCGWTDCTSDQYWGDDRMECRSSYCWCKKGMNYTTGECRNANRPDHGIQGKFAINFTLTGRLEVEFNLNKDSVKESLDIH